MMYEFKITLRGLSNPEVWRTISIPGNYSFFKFHKVIQAVFGWENLHFFEFVVTDGDKTTHIYMPHEENTGNDGNFADATTERIENIVSGGITHITYKYDRNDNWIHDIALISRSEDAPSHPKCIEGGGMCPPEGCNGSIGYEHIKFILRERPESDEAKRCREWLFLEDDDEFNPEYFPESEINDINEILERYL